MDKITSRTLKWAQSHDWGHKAWLSNGILKGLRDRYSDGTDREIWFTSRSALRDWAGY